MIAKLAASLIAFALVAIVAALVGRRCDRARLREMADGAKPKGGGPAET